MKFSPDSIFSEFKNQVLEDSYYPSNLVDTLKARLTATMLLQSDNLDYVNKAKALIKKTSTAKEEDLERLLNLSAQIRSWDELQICSTYDNTQGSFLEYKLSYTLKDGEKKTVHYHALYETTGDRCNFISQTPPLIRLTGDPVLQKPGIPFPDAPTPDQEKELKDQIELAKKVLIQTSGAGIAANQCAAIKDPYCFTIVGVFNDIPEHVNGVEKRYPGTKFPQAKIMVNPVIKTQSKETQQFNHACLSVPCGNRCAVISPLKISVSYLDYLDNMAEKEQKYIGIDAVVLWHELTHILNGKTYMDVTFACLPPEDLVQFQKMLTDELQRRQENSYSQIPVLSVPPFHISVPINEEGIPFLDPVKLAEVLPKMTEDALSGLLAQADLLLKDREINKESWVTNLSVFSSNKETRHGAVDDVPECKLQF